MGEEDTVSQKPNYFNLLICHLGVNHLTLEWWWNFEKLVLGYFLTLSSTIANWGGMAMEPDKIFCCMFLFDFLALTVHETQYLCSLPTEEQTNRNVLVTLFVHSVYSNRKIVHSRGPSNINLCIFVCSFDVCPLRFIGSLFLDTCVCVYFSPCNMLF